MKDKIHIVLDLETMGNGPNAAITAIGAARAHQGTVTDKFYRKVDLASSMASGGIVTASTIEWWLVQSEGARLDITQPGVHIVQALTDFIEWAKPGCDLVWGNGSSFDNVILTSAFRNAGFHEPWPFWCDRDLRTILGLYPEAKNIPFEGTKHNAVDDAVHQAKQLIGALKRHYA